MNIIISADSSQGDRSVIRVWKKKRHGTKENDSFKNSCNKFLAMLLQVLMLLASIAFLRQNIVSTTSLGISDNKNLLFICEAPSSYSQAMDGEHRMEPKHDLGVRNPIKPWRKGP